MTTLQSLPIDKQYIKTRWGEQYTSEALNRSKFKASPRGVYAGFEIVPGPAAFQVSITHQAETNVSGYMSGNFDAADGWSIAIYEGINGFSTTVAIQEAPGSDFVFDLTAYKGTSVFAAIDVKYIHGVETTGFVRIVDDAALDLDPALVCLGRINVPMSGSIQAGNIFYNDSQYPRILPDANPYKRGYMSKQQAEALELIGFGNSSPAFEAEVIAPSDGPQTITVPAPYTYAVGGIDLFVFKNGTKMKRGRDYTEVNRGDGFGEEIQWIGQLKTGDRIDFRGQKFGASLTNTLFVFDEGAQVSSNVTRMNFRGSGVNVVPVGAGQVDVIVGGGGGGASLTRQKLNNSGSAIVAVTAVHLDTDGSIIPCNPTDPGHRLFGITTGPIAPGDYGEVQLVGVVLGAMLGSGFAVGDYVYVADDGSGSLTNVQPPALTSQVIQVGFVDCQDGSASSTPSDLVIDKRVVV